MLNTVAQPRNTCNNLAVLGTDLHRLKARLRHTRHNEAVLGSDFHRLKASLVTTTLDTTLVVSGEFIRNKTRPLCLLASECHTFEKIFVRGVKRHAVWCVSPPKVYI